MKLSSISGYHCYVADLARTAEFYEKLGFRAGKQEADRRTFYVNWFFATFVAQDQIDDAELRSETEQSPKGAGVLVYLKVEDLDEFYKGIVKLGMTPASEPQKRPNRDREFMLRDPDGYRLVFFEKK